MKQKYFLISNDIIKLMIMLYLQEKNNIFKKRNKIYLFPLKQGVKMMTVLLNIQGVGGIQ